MNTRKNNNKSDVNDEVEELLRAAEDAALLKLTLNSHAVHASSSNLHPDLDLRFHNLKTGSKLKEVSNKNTVPQEPKNVKKEVDDDDLLARFAALKASIPKPPPSTSSSLVGLYTSDTHVDNTVEDGEDDEVEKVIRWAMDAARLDPSPASDDEDNNSDDIDDTDKSDDNTDKSDEDADSPSGNHKNQRK